MAENKDERSEGNKKLKITLLLSVTPFEFRSRLKLDWAMQQIKDIEKLMARGAAGLNITSELLLKLITP